MFINPKIAIEKGWVTGIKNEKLQLQPNALDFTLDHLYEVKHNEFIICADPDNPEKELKQMRGSTEVFPYPDRRTGVQFYNMSKNSYDATSDMYVDLPEGVAALTIIRSTFNRNGIFLTSGLYDTFFRGHIGFVLHNMIGGAKIEQGTRVGQIIFVKSENAGVYSGGYSHEQGTHWSDSKVEHNG